MKPILVDTGPLYAMTDRGDSSHGRISAFLTNTSRQLVVPITVLPEVCYLISTHLGASAEVQLVQAIQRREVKVEFMKGDDLARTVEVMGKYADVAMGFVDASIVAVGERLKIRELMTTDRRHFTIVRPRHCVRFDLKP